MTKIEWRNRYGDTVSFRQLNANTWLFDVDNELPWQFSASSVDPTGGPFIGIGSRLRELHLALPDCVVSKVGFGVYDTDSSGYEYTGCLIHTS
jgi:hypothetical protein